jgi:chemotaxis methyl-accepting protein methylase
MTAEIDAIARAELPEPFADVLALLRGYVPTDFSKYRDGTIRRRIENRMAAVGAESVAAYLTILRSSQSEVLKLAEQLTVKVSSFYRDRRAFHVLRTHVLPFLARTQRPDAIRIWSAGCGRGEEAYTLAMLLDEQGSPGYVCATDIDPAALAAARKALYRHDALTELPRELSEQYLHTAPGQVPTQVAVRENLRVRVRFSVHDLLAATRPDPLPFHLISCRNVLIYFKRTEQPRVLRRLHSALAPGGFLFLGEAEWPMGLEHLFVRHASGTRVFQAVA